MEDRKAKVLIIGGLPRPSGGVTVFLGRLVNRLGRKIDFHVLDIHAGDKEPTLAVRHEIAPRSILMKNIWLFLKICTFSGDIIHFNHSRLGSLLFISLMPKFRRKFFLTLHNGSLFEDLPPSGLKRLLMLYAVRKLDLLFALCDNHRKTFDALGVSPAKIANTKSHVPPSAPKTELKDDRIDRLFETHDEVVICSGHVDQIYNYEFAIRFLNDNPHVGAAFFFYGRFMDRDYLERLKASVASDSQVVFLFHKSESEFLSVLQKSTLFLRPNFVDSWGISVADSIILGVPAIASDVCERYPGAILFETGNYDAFCEAVRSGLSRGHQHVSEADAIADTAEHYEKAYCSVLRDET